MNSKTFPKKAMLLAAGFGERLRPLTLTLPKPLIPIGNHSLVEYNLALLNRFGIREVMINLHYLGEKIKQKIGNKYLNLKIFYSEEKEILGTGGALKEVESFFEQQSFFLLNADILIDLDLQKLFSFHQSKKSLATLVVTKSERRDIFRSVFIDEDQQIIDINTEEPTRSFFQKTIFTGAQLIEPEALKHLVPHQNSCLIEKVYLPSIRENQKKVSAYLFDQYWRDVGTLERYEQVKKEFEHSWPYTTLKPEDFLSK